MTVRKRIRELLKIAAKKDKKGAGTPYKKGMKMSKKYHDDKPKRRYSKRTTGTSSKKVEHGRMKYASEQGFIDGFVDFLEEAGFDKEAAEQLLGKQAFEMSPTQAALLAGTAGLGLGGAGGYGLARMLGGGGEDQGLAPGAEESMMGGESQLSPEELMMLQQYANPYGEQIYTSPGYYYQ